MKTNNRFFSGVFFSSFYAIALAAIVAASSVSSSAAPATYFGEDLGVGATGARPNSDNARAQFLAQLSAAVGTEDFEDFQVGASAPLEVDFGYATATLGGSGEILSTSSQGRFPTSGSKFWENSSGSFSISFDAPQAAFGFYGSDIGDIGGQLTLTLHYVSGTNETLTVPNTIDSPNSSCLFFGILTTASNQFTRIDFGNTEAGTDTFGFDDFTIGTIEQVQPTSAEAIFEPGPDMPVARKGHHVVTLPDGRAALFGGHGQGFVSLSSADFWTPGENSFSSKVMNQTHDSSIFTRLVDGRYLLAGGSSNLGVPAYAYSEIYDPVADTFTTSGNMVRFRASSGSAALSDGRVLIAGAWWTHNDAHTYGELFTPAAGSYQAVGPFSVSRSHAIVLPMNDGSGVVLGGRQPRGSYQEMPVEHYDPATGAITVKQAALFPGESGWQVTLSNRLCAAQEMSNGRYLWMATRVDGDITHYRLFTFDPEDGSVDALPMPRGLPDSSSGSLMQVLVDAPRNRAYIPVVVPQASGHPALEIISIDTNTGAMVHSSNSYLPGYSWPGAEFQVLADGRIFITGGSADGTNFNPVSNTLLVTPPEVNILGSGLAPEVSVVEATLPGETITISNFETTFVSSSHFSVEWEGDFYEGEWSYEVVGPNVGKITMTYGYPIADNPSEYREEILLTFTSENAGTYVYRQYDQDALDVEEAGSFDFPFAWKALTDVAPTEAEVLATLPSVNFSEATFYDPYYDNNYVATSLTFTSSDRFSRLYLGESYSGDWSYELLEPNVGKVTLVYDGWNDYKEELILTFTDETSGGYVFSEFDSGVVGYYEFGSFILPFDWGADPVWHAGASDLGSNWRWLDWFGAFNISNDPWIFHAEHGWLWTFASGSDNVYLWDDEMGSMLWTSENVYPALYRFSDNSWLFYDVGSKNPRWFVNLVTGVWESVGGDPDPDPDLSGMVLVEAETGGDAFYIGQTEVTWREWQTVQSYASDNGYDIGTRGSGCGEDHPVGEVSWFDVLKWCNAKSEQEGLTPVYTYNGSTYRSGEPTHYSISQNLSASGFRLPQEAEWVFAARGGNQSNGYTYAGSNDLNEVGWYYGNSSGAACDLYNGRGTWPVGQKAANELGLYDMSGNVYEWCWDQYGSNRRLRGGSFYYGADRCAISYRPWDNPESSHGSLGFRLALTPSP